MEREKLLVLVDILNIKRGRNACDDVVSAAYNVLNGEKHQGRYAEALAKRVLSVEQTINDYSNDMLGNFMLFSELSGIDGNKPAHRAVLNSIKSGTTISMECSNLNCFSFTAYSLNNRIVKLMELRKSLENL